MVSSGALGIGLEHERARCPTFRASSTCNSSRSIQSYARTLRTPCHLPIPLTRCLPLHTGASTAWEAFGSPLFLFQNLAGLEVAHAATGMVRAGFATTLLQVLPREISHWSVHGDRLLLPCLNGFSHGQIPFSRRSSRALRSYTSWHTLQPSKTRGLCSRPSLHGRSRRCARCSQLLVFVREDALTIARTPSCSARYIRNRDRPMH
eukprot:scaffold64632_cov31-Tisochrysis_lutea.AAC.5